jgi:hypothetical protein
VRCGARWCEVGEKPDQNCITVHVSTTHMNPLEYLLLGSSRIVTRIDYTNHFHPFNSVLLLAKSPVDGCPEDSFSAAAGVTINTSIYMRRSISTDYSSPGCERWGFKEQGGWGWGTCQYGCQKPIISGRVDEEVEVGDGEVEDADGEVN